MTPRKKCFLYPLFSILALVIAGGVVVVIFGVMALIAAQGDFSVLSGYLSLRTADDLTVINFVNNLTALDWVKIALSYMLFGSIFFWGHCAVRRFKDNHQLSIGFGGGSIIIWGIWLIYKIVMLHLTFAVSFIVGFVVFPIAIYKALGDEDFLNEYKT